MTTGERSADEMPLPGGDFRLFLTRLAVQGMMSLGLMDNPMTGTRIRNLPHAEMMIEDLRMLREKTLGNLAPGEAAQLDKIISDLEHAFAQSRTETADS